MRNSKLRLSIWITSLLAWSLASFAQNDQDRQVTSLSDIKQFTEKELAGIKSRYAEYGDNQQLFSEDQFKTISEKQLAPIIKPLILHKKIKFSDTDSLVLFATQISDSRYTLAELKPRIIRYIRGGALIFQALEKAILREDLHVWKADKKQEIRKDKGPFIKKIAALNLTEADHDKVINAYAVCVASFRNADERQQHMQPKICNPTDDFPKPRHKNHSAKVRETPAGENTPRVMAYRELTKEAAAVAKEEQLSVFEKIFMAKCIAEQSLRFFTPARHPFKALGKTCAMNKKSPEEAFFMNNGVCGNFSGVAYNIANALGLKGQVFLAKNNVHVYLEFTADDEWYHTHPFNSKSSCDINRFP